MTPDARSRAGFELRRFTAAPVPGALVVLELEGRVARQAGRFARHPVLVVEADDRPRLEVAPVRATLEDGRWRGAYAVPAEALSDGVRLALGLRGTLLELPAPDEPGDADRLTALAREANGLRRLLEAAEAEALAARREAADATAALDVAVAGAREEERAASAQRMEDLEREVVEAHRVAAGDVHEARAAAIAATRAEHEQAVAEATERAQLAEQHAEEAEARARAAEEAAQAAERAGTVAEEARAAAEAGTDVLRAELAEERERARAAVEELQARADRDDETTRQFTVAEERDADAEATAPLTPRRNAGAADPTRDERARQRAGIFDPLPADAPEHPRHGPSLSRWVAVGALLLFALALLGLVFGFLG